MKKSISTFNVLLVMLALAGTAFAENPSERSDDSRRFIEKMLMDDREETNATNLLSRNEVNTICSDIRLQMKYALGQTLTLKYDEQNEETVTNFEDDPYNLSHSSRMAFTLQILSNLTTINDRSTLAKLSSLFTIVKDHTYTLAGFLDSYALEFSRIYETSLKQGEVTIRSTNTTAKK